MKYFSFFLLLLSAALAEMLKLDVGIDPELPSCGSHCMVDSMFITHCLDMNCLCHQEEYQKSLFQCLYSQCDSTDYGKALSRTITTCIGLGAEIHMVAPGLVNEELLRVREADYLAGRQLPEVPGLQMRQESIPVATITTTFTDSVTLTLAFSPTPTPFLTSSPEESSSINRPWAITQSDASRFEASFTGSSYGSP